MKNAIISFLLFSCFIGGDVLAFCGFYVAKADAELFNTSSQVIMARDGDKTVVTMFSNFQGSVQDFAMVVPVPQILQEHHIRVVEASIFAKLDVYSGPRLVEYHDQNPCNVYNRPVALKSMSRAESLDDISVNEESTKKTKDLGVTVEAKYTIGEYDILILSAKESDGLKTWLTDNEYKMPEKAEEALDPYIKSGMKFFVVKVNLDEYDKSTANDLKPLQIAFESKKFMLPIRLGMANAEGDQDMIVYTFTKKGRVETTNYATRKIPTDKEIPTFMKPEFGKFYHDLFDKAWKQKKNASYLEYAWDLSSSNFVKCDPCATTPPTYSELEQAGVFWVTGQGGWGANYQGDVFMTRLHVRYNRESFPQDLAFQATGNKKQFQGRYIMRHPAKGDLMSCDQGKAYVEKLIKRRKGELKELSSLTGWATSKYSSAYVAPYEKMLADVNLPDEKSPSDWNPFGKSINTSNNTGTSTSTSTSTSNNSSSNIVNDDRSLLEKDGMEPEVITKESKRKSIGAVSKSKAGLVLSGFVVLLAFVQLRRTFFN